MFGSLFLAAVFLFAVSTGSDFEPVKLKCEYLVNPLAVQSQNPRLSWNFVATDPLKNNLSQTAYQVLVGSTESTLGDLWDSGKVPSDQSIHVKYDGAALDAGQRAYWTVTVWDQNGEPSATRPLAHWDNGLKTTDWVGQWITAPAGLQDDSKVDLDQIDADVMTALPGLKAVVFLRKEFDLPATSNISRAKIYSSAKGAYNLLLNGGRVSDEELAPGWTDFTQTIQYQSYDVTSMIKGGNTNAIGVILGTGWFSGYIGFNRESDYYGTEQSFLFELHVEYEDGSSVIVSSDESWKSSTGPFIYSDMLHGEVYYENRDFSTSHQGLPPWATVGYSDESWVPALPQPIDVKVDLIPDRAEPIRVTQELRPVGKYESGPGVWVLDFGQNMVGWVRIHLETGTPVSRIQLRHAEVLEDNGTIYTLNLRSARATDTYVITGMVKFQSFLAVWSFVIYSFPNLF
jgi:alpha-L-rhamnosidase